MTLGRDSSAGIAALAMMMSFFGHCVARTRPTPELHQLDDALPGNLINNATRLNWNMFSPGITNKPVKGKDIPGGGALQFSIPKASAKQTVEIGRAYVLNDMAP